MFRAEGLGFSRSRGCGGAGGPHKRMITYCMVSFEIPPVMETSA